MSFSIDGLVEFGVDEGFGVCIASTLLVYDFLLTLPLEKRFVWGARWTYGKALFVFIRYTAFFFIPMSLYLAFAYPASERSCTAAVYSLMIVAYVIALCADFVLALRTWAIWERNLYVGGLVGIAWLATTVIVLLNTAYAIEGIIPYSEVDIPGVVGCLPAYNASAAAAALKTFYALAAYEGLILGMTILRGLRYLYRPTPLILTLYRDAFLASICLLTLTIVDAQMAITDSPQFYLPFVLSMAFYFVCPCRIILNLRASVGQVDGWDLATTVPERSSVSEIWVDTESTWS